MTGFDQRMIVKRNFYPRMEGAVNDTPSVHGLRGVHLEMRGPGRGRKCFLTLRTRLIEEGGSVMYMGPRLATWGPCKMSLLYK